jgi:hypothetical protein
VGGVVPEGVESSSFGTGVGEREIGGVGMDLEEHGSDDFGSGSSHFFRSGGGDVGVGFSLISSVNV